MTQYNRRQILRHGTFGALAAASLPAFLAACGSDSPEAGGATDAPKPTDGTKTTDGGAAGSLTGTVNFLNFDGWVGAGEYAGFAAKFPGAKVNPVPWASVDDTIAKAKGRAGDIDVVLVDGTTFPSLDALGVLAEFGDGVPNLGNIDKAYKGKSWDPKDTRFAATDYGRTGMAYRADIVTEKPTTLAEFFEIAPKYAGKVVILDYQRSVMGSVLRMLKLSESTKEQGDIDKVVEILKKLKPSLLAISTEVGKQLASGEAVLALGDAYDIFNAKTQTDAVTWVDQSEGQVAYLEGLAILDGPRNDLARAFVNFHLDPANYADFINTVSSAGTMPDNQTIKAELRTTPILNPGADVRNNIVFHQVLGDAQSIWDTAWDAFKAA
jgi:spermidine/putrescine transport system substrate-binding protein